MFKLIVITAFTLFPIFVIAQQVHGKIYDNEASVKGAKISNISKNSFTYSNEFGDFSITASVQDTLKITSLFHEEKKVLISALSFENTIVIEIKKIINNLDEVLISEEIKKPFNAETYTVDMGLQLKNDMKNNPHLYSAPPSGNLDLIKIAGLIAKLFKNKENTKETPNTSITYKELDSLFANHKLMNEQLLKNDFKIPEIYIPLFFDYCANKNIDSKLLSEDNNILLLDKLFNYSEEFLKVLSDYKNEQIKH
ncbi:hypothetical protein [Mariniflexile sp.]|uniref:hypothetical protein n=1 Tax=Mariniflexile sp. TaxID=1979402 RepID=UPI003562F7AF